MFYDLSGGLLIPLFGTTAGSSCVFFMKNGKMNREVQCALSCIAAGIMTAASVWSLLIPSYEMASQGKMHPVILPNIGFWSGIIFVLAVDALSRRLKRTAQNPLFLTAFTVALHNLPEGMAVGAVYAGLLSENPTVSAAEALALSIGIACQNFPEGAIISVPLYSSGKSRFKSFILGFLSGVVEPVGTLLTLSLSRMIIPALPWFLSFAAGAMIYVVTEELIPMKSIFRQNGKGAMFFSIGFCIMMSLDMAL